MDTKVHFSSKSNERATPQDFFDKLDHKYNFNLDPCATSENHKCGTRFNQEMNGLKQKWSLYRNSVVDLENIFNGVTKEKSRVFCNPPYGRELKEWVKASEEIRQPYCDLVVMLIPARTDTKYFHEYIYDKENVEIKFIKGRLKFGGSDNPAPFPSMLVIFKSSNYIT